MNRSQTKNQKTKTTHDNSKNNISISIEKKIECDV